MSAKHTPGPWAADIAHEQLRAVVRHGMTPIAEMWMTGQPMAEREANACLIAAAPELLEALIAFQRAHDLADSESDRLLVGMQMGCAYEMARVAIAKATGAAQ